MGRLIDADSIFPWYVKAFSKERVGEEREIKPNDIRFSMNDIKENLDNIPTVDAIPRETINAMISDILKFKNEVEKHECIEFSKSYAAGMQQALEIIYKFTYNGGNDGET